MALGFPLYIHIMYVQITTRHVQNLLIHLQQTVDGDLLVSSACFKNRSDHFFVHVREHVFDLKNTNLKLKNVQQLKLRATHLNKNKSTLKSFEVNI